MLKQWLWRAKQQQPNGPLHPTPVASKVWLGGNSSAQKPLLPSSPPLALLLSLLICAGLRITCNKSARSGARVHGEQCERVSALHTPFCAPSNSQRGTSLYSQTCYSGHTDVASRGVNTPHKWVESGRGWLEGLVCEICPSMPFLLLLTPSVRIQSAKHICHHAHSYRMINTAGETVLSTPWSLYTTTVLLLEWETITLDMQVPEIIRYMKGTITISHIKFTKFIKSQFTHNREYDMYLT